MKDKTTIGILSHNRSWHFAQCIASIREHTRSPYVIKVLDVGSDERHKEHIKQFESSDCVIEFNPNFLSCLEGRRELLPFMDTEFVAYLDDDCRVGPCWLENLLRPMRADEECGAVAANIVQEGQKVTSGVRGLSRSGRHLSVKELPVNYIGEADLCLGGATLYRLDVLRKTELRKEFSGGYEDWDQTLQITQELNRKIYGSRATVFHKHMPECREYFSDRWRWRELLEAALAMFDRWEIRSAVDKVMRHYHLEEIVVPREYAERIVEVIT